ncbi:trimeric intracellular cation channel family protein [Telmatospirillum sp. J64-1]|uniref:trimeric intracellular cation channel family protein n=1 Tax=Telmatospirillum sp. J64-1 TaxID=2502183 RepID=UPI0021074188|nr:trimeric intracellular cation channel family protein [Telmatospirillum sp. J64-1]
MDDFDLFFLALDYVGVAVFAVSGGLVAARKRMDLVGFAVLGCAAGIGGGTLRDLVLGVRPVFWVFEPAYILICVAASCATFFWASHIASRMKALLWADAIGLGVFTVIGCEKAMALGAPPVIAVVTGIMTASFGGLIRDIMAREVPLIFRREIYATAALSGALVYVLLHEYHLPKPSIVGSAFLTTFLVRALAITRGLALPVFKPHNQPKAEDTPPQP